MNLELLYQAGIWLMAADLLWLLFYYFYATVEVYNLVEENSYQYMGSLWIKKKKGDHYLYLTREIEERSYTTEYKIVPGCFFCFVNKKEKIRISFQGKYEVLTEISDPITVKNYIATYPGL